MSDQLTCGEALVRLLEAYGVVQVFGIPATHIIELYRGLHGRPVRHVLARHEQGAGFMAEGYARLSGKPGVCFLATGPGLLNAATPIASAHNDSLPLLVVTSNLALTSLGKGWGDGHEMRDQRGLTESITAFSATAYSPADLPDLVARAFAVFASGRPRPVHIEVPTDVLAGSVTAADFESQWRARGVSRPPAPAPESLAEAAGLIDRAKKRLLYVGGGTARCAKEIRALAEHLAAPVINTVGGIGCFPGSHPLSLGAAMSFEAGRKVAERADVLIALGTEMGVIDQWYAPLQPPEHLIRVDLDREKLADHHNAAVAIQADAGLTAAALTAATRAAPAGARKDAESRVAAIRAAMTESLDPLEKRHAKVLATIRAALPEDSLFFGDMTQLAYTAARIGSFDRPRQYSHPLGFGCLGHALPNALGGKLAEPDRTAVVLVGDSGLLYTVQEMATAIDEDLPLIVVVWNNFALGEIRDGFLRRGIEPLAVTPKPPDHLALAESFGWRALRAHNHDALSKGLKSAADSGEATLIEILENDF